MTSTSNSSGFVEFESLPEPRIFFVGTQATYEVSGVFFPALFKLNPNGLVVGMDNIDGMEDGGEIHLCLSSEQGTTNIVHFYDEEDDYQGVGVTKEQALVHQGQQVTVTYTAFIGGVGWPSLTAQFTIATDNLDLEKLPHVLPLDAQNNVLKLHLIEAQGGARFQIPPIEGIHRGTQMTVTLFSGSLQFTVGRVISTTPAVGLKLLVPFHQAAAFLGREVSYSYAIQLLPDVVYNRLAPGTFIVEP